MNHFATPNIIPRAVRNFPQIWIQSEACKRNYRDNSDNIDFNKNLLK